MSDSQRPTGQLFVITAASGTGKTSLVKQLLAHTDKLTVSISHTTRSPRPGETDGLHYHFVDEHTFQKNLEQGMFLEHAKVFDHFYGTSKQAVLDQLNTGVDVVLEIDWQGALQVKQIFDHVIMIFILPPSQSALKERLCARGQDSLDVIEHRLAGAIDEMRQYVHFDYVVVNDDFSQALKELQAIVTAQRLRCAQQAIKQQQMIANLLVNT